MTNNITFASKFTILKSSPIIENNGLFYNLLKLETIHSYYLMIL